MKTQIVIIHGGDTFDTHEEYLSFLKNSQIDFERYRAGKRDWKSTLAEALGKNYEVILPSMPSKTNAKYAEWKLWFEKFILHFEPEVVLVGHSLGGTFLVKYLAENDFPKKIRALFLVAAPYDDKDSKESLADFALPKNLGKLEKRSGKIFMYHSKDDLVVPFADFEKYRGSIQSATAKTFSDRGHFNQETFPELIRDIKNI